MGCGQPWWALQFATVAQLAEQGLRKAKVGGSMPLGSSSDRGCGSMAERKLPKLETRVRFPSSAQMEVELDDWYGEQLGIFASWPTTWCI